MLKMKNICVRNVLNDLNLTVNEGEFVLVVGENGAGKTTLFNTISGNVQPSKGQILIAGEDVTNVPQYRRAGLIANVFQDPKVGTIANMSIRDNLNMACLRGKNRKLCFSCSSARDDFFRTKLREIDLGGRLDAYAGELSGGQRQALSIVMALLTDSKLLLLDEVTAALDSANAEKVLKIIDENVYKQRKTCLMITHNKDHIDRLGDRILKLQNGKVWDL